MRRHGFTLIELLVVIAIIVSLLAILMPSLSKATEQAIRVQCSSRMHQLGVGEMAYAADHFGRLIRRSGPFPDYVAVLHTSPPWDARAALLAYTGDARVSYCPAETSAEGLYDAENFAVASPTTVFRRTTLRWTGFVPDANAKFRTWTDSAVIAAPLTLFDQPQWKVAVTDLFASWADVPTGSQPPTYPNRNAHGVPGTSIGGLNALYRDGSARWTGFGDTSIFVARNEGPHPSAFFWWPNGTNPAK